MNMLARLWLHQGTSQAHLRKPAVAWSPLQPMKCPAPPLRRLICKRLSNHIHKLAMQIDMMHHLALCRSQERQAVHISGIGVAMEVCSRNNSLACIWNRRATRRECSSSDRIIWGQSSELHVIESWVLRRGGRLSNATVLRSHPSTDLTSIICIRLSNRATSRHGNHICLD